MYLYQIASSTFHMKEIQVTTAQANVVSLSYLSNHRSGGPSRPAGTQALPKVWSSLGGILLLHTYFSIA